MAFIWHGVYTFHDVIAYCKELRLLAAGIKPSQWPYIHSSSAANPVWRNSSYNVGSSAWGQATAVLSGSWQSGRAFFWVAVKRKLQLILPEILLGMHLKEPEWKLKQEFLSKKLLHEIYFLSPLIFQYGIWTIMFIPVISHICVKLYKS